MWQEGQDYSGVSWVQDAANGVCLVPGVGLFKRMMFCAAFATHNSSQHADRVLAVPSCSSHRCSVIPDQLGRSCDQMATLSCRCTTHLARVGNYKCLYCAPHLVVKKVLLNGC